MSGKPQRPAFILSSKDVIEVPGKYSHREEIFSLGRSIGEMAGLKKIAVHIERLNPGHRSSLPHAEEKDEEFVYVLRGQVDAWIDGTIFQMFEGDFAAFPAGTGICHAFLNNSDKDVLLLVGGERTSGNNRTYYPLNPERQNEMPDSKWWPLQRKQIFSQ